MTDIQKEQIIRLRAAGNGYGKIAKTIGISLNTIKSFCRRNNICGAGKNQKISATVAEEITRCENCGQEIWQVAKRKKKRFCCDKCRNAWWNSHLDQVKRKTVYSFTCTCCGKEFSAYGNRRRKYCSHACYIARRYGREVPAHA